MCSSDLCKRAGFNQRWGNGMDISSHAESVLQHLPVERHMYDGTITNNPIYARIQAAEIKFTGWSYGFGGGYYGGEGSDWYTNSLLGFSQVGDTLTIQSFTDASGKDHSQPVNQVTYTACSASTT